MDKSAQGFGTESKRTKQFKRLKELLLLRDLWGIRFNCNNCVKCIDIEQREHII